MTEPFDFGSRPSDAWVKFARLKEAPLNVAWLNNGSSIVAACADGAIRLVDPDSVEVTGEIQALNGWAYSLAVHPTDGSVVVGGPNAQVRRIVPEYPKPYFSTNNCLVPNTISKSLYRINRTAHPDSVGAVLRCTIGVEFTLYLL